MSNERCSHYNIIIYKACCQFHIKGNSIGYRTAQLLLFAEAASTSVVLCFHTIRAYKLNFMRGSIYYSQLKNY